jgi:hypothetical protein
MTTWERNAQESDMEYCRQYCIAELPQNMRQCETKTKKNKKKTEIKFLEG